MSTLSNPVVGSSARPSLPLGRLLGRGLAVGLVAALANLGVYAIGRALAVPFLIPPQPGAAGLAPLPIPAIIMASVVPALAAALLLAVLARFAARPVRLFQVIGALFLLVSFVPILTLPVDTATQLALAAMHVVAGVVIIAGLSATR